MKLPASYPSAVTRSGLEGRAIIILFVQLSKSNGNSRKSNFQLQKVHKSSVWIESSVVWSLVYLNFAVVNNLQFLVCPSVTKTILMWNDMVWQWVWHLRHSCLWQMHEWLAVRENLESILKKFQLIQA